MSALKKLFKGKDDPNRYQPVPREQYIRLGLATPPENGYDDFLKLVWCRDTKEEKRQMKKAEKEAGKKKDGANNITPENFRSYVLCIVGYYEPYRPNDPPINLNKRGYKPLPKWDDGDFRDEILRNGYFFQNDAFILEHYKQAIKPAADYPYAEQFILAYKHWNDGLSPTQEQIREHKVSVAVVIMDDVDQLEHNNNNSQAQEAPAAAADEEDSDDDDEGGTNNNNNKDDELLQKMKDILQSMDVLDDEAMVEECQKRLEQRKASKKK